MSKHMQKVIKSYLSDDKKWICIHYSDGGVIIKKNKLVKNRSKQAFLAVLESLK